jgi:uncharacterized membrane protein YfhO
MMFIWFYFPAVVLAAYALDEFINFKWGEDPVRTKRIIFFGGITGGCAVLYMLFAGPFAEYWYQNLYPKALQDQNKLNALTNYLPDIKSGAYIMFVIYAAILTLIYIKATNKISLRFFLVLITVLLVIDQVRIARPFFTQSIKPSDYYTRQEAGEQSIGAFLNNRDRSIFRVQSMMGDQKMYIKGIDFAYIFDDFTDKRYDDVVKLLLGYSNYLSRSNVQLPPEAGRIFSSLLNFFNVKYVLALNDLPVPGLQTIAQNGNFRIYENQFNHPRFYLSENITRVKDPLGAVMSAINGQGIEIHTVIVEDTSFLSNVVLDTFSDTTIIDSIKVLKRDVGQGDLIFEVASKKERVLVINENYNPGWKATINGVPTEVFPANYVWKGIVVPKGVSRVELKYNSPVATFWRKVTVVSAIVFLLFIIGGIAYEFRSRKKGLPATA